MTTEEKTEIKEAIDEAFENDSTGALSKLRIQLKKIVDSISEESGPAVEADYLLASISDFDMDVSSNAGDLPFIDGKSFATHFPTHLIIKIKTGVASPGASFNLKMGALYFEDDITISDPQPNSKQIYSLGRPNQSANLPTDNESVPNIIVSANNGGVLTIDIFLYGLPY